MKAKVYKDPRRQKHPIKQLFHVGDKVSMELWNRSLPPSKRVDPIGTVNRVQALQMSETGYMVTVKFASGRDLTVDQNWLRPVPLVDDNQ